RVQGQAEDPEHKSDDQRGEAPLGVQAPVEDAEHEHREDRRGEVALHALEIVVRPTCALDHGNPQKAAHHHHAGGGAPHPNQMMPSTGTRPVFASARAIKPGMMKMNTGNNFKYAAKMLPRRAVRSFFALRARCTMYWSVHQYHRPMMGAQSSMPGHG